MSDKSSNTVTEDDASLKAINHRSIIKVLRNSEVPMGPKAISEKIGKPYNQVRGIVVAMETKGLLRRVPGEHGLYRLATKQEFYQKKKGASRERGRQKLPQEEGVNILDYLSQLGVSLENVDSLVNSVLSNESSGGSDMVTEEGVQIEREGKTTRHTIEHTNTIDLKEMKHVRVFVVVEVTEIEDTPPSKSSPDT